MGFQEVIPGLDSIMVRDIWRQGLCFTYLPPKYCGINALNMMPVSGYLFCLCRWLNRNICFCWMGYFAKTCLNYHQKCKLWSRFLNWGPCCSSRWEKQRAAPQAFHYILREYLPILQFLKIDFHLTRSLRLMIQWDHCLFLFSCLF